MNEAELVDAMAAASWNTKANILWKDIPSEWKPYYLACQRAALSVMYDYFHAENVRLTAENVQLARRADDLEDRIRAMSIANTFDERTLNGDQRETLAEDAE